MNGEVIDDMKNKKLILSVDDKSYYIESFEDLLGIIFDKEYKDKTFEEKYLIRLEKAFQITMETQTELVDTRVGLLNSDGKVVSKSYNFSNAFIIDNDKTFILSLIKFKNMVLLEKYNENIFYIDGIIKDLDKSCTDENNEYIIINKIIDKLLLLNMKLK